MPQTKHKPLAVASVASPGLTEVLTFMQLIWAVNHELERVSLVMETTLGVTIPQRMSLLLIGARPGILASELAESLHLHRGTLSGVLRRLQDSGLIDRTVDSADARRVGLTLTPAGVRLAQRHDGTFEEAVRALLADTSASDRDATARVLSSLRGALRG